MTTLTILTLTLAKAYGIYIFASGLSGLAMPDRWKQVMEDFQRSPGLTYLTAVIVIGFGIVMIMLHSSWTDPLAIIISLVGWIALLEGVLLMAAPEGLLKLGAATVATRGRTRAWAVIALVIGIALLAAGLTGRANISP